MIYFLLALALAVAFANYVKIIELDNRLKKIEDKMRWWL
jgi:hypothetical protein